MEHEEIVNTILDKLGWFYEDIARKKHGSFKGWTKGELISLIILHGTGPKVAAVFGCGNQAFNRTVSSILVPLFGPLKGGGESWKNVLLNYAGIKWCPKCNSYKEHSKFSKDNHNPYGLQGKCKKCASTLGVVYYKTPSGKESHLRSYARNKEKITQRLLERKLHIKLATPKWADLEAIKEVYKNCPEGFHVDHEVPLRGKLVCGLHVHKNLKPIPAKENLVKGNKYIP